MQKEKRKICLIVGAGFSAPYGLPLAKDLFNEIPEVPFKRIQKLCNVIEGWWDRINLNGPIHPEIALNYLKYGYDKSSMADLINKLYYEREWGDIKSYSWLGKLTLEIRGKEYFQEPKWQDVVQFIGWRLAHYQGRIEPSPRREFVDDEKGRGYRTIYGDRFISDSVRTSNYCPAHQGFWKGLLADDRFSIMGIISFNYDILIERSLGLIKRKTKHRPGFFYPKLSPKLFEVSNPHLTYATLDVGLPTKEKRKWRFEAIGEIPLCKLHGSLNWQVKNDKIYAHYRCLPAFFGDAYIVPPIVEKQIEPIIKPIWEYAKGILYSSDTWLIVGYSMPEYDLAVNSLLQECYNGQDIFVMTPSDRTANKLKKLLGSSKIYSKGPLSNLNPLPNFMSVQI